MKKLTAVLLSLCTLLGLFCLPGAAGTDFENLYDFYTSYCGYITSEGKSLFDPDYQTTNFLAVKAGEVLTAGPFSAGQKIYAVCYDSSKKFLRQAKPGGSELRQTATLSGGKYLLSYTVPSDVSYVRFTFGAEYYNTFLAVKNPKVTAAEYDAWIDKQGLRKYIDFINADKSKFSAKELLWCGDSVGNGSYEHYYEGADLGKVTSKSKYAFAKRVSHLLGMKSFKNTSSGGATLSTKYPSSIIPQKIEQNANAKTEYLVIEGGIVDICGYGKIVVPTGYMSDSFDPSSFAGENTFLGGLEKCFYLATKLAPNAVIVFVMCYSVPSNKNGLYAWDRCWQYVPAVCEKWGIPMISLYTNDTVNEAFDHDRSVGGLMYYDNLHCSPFGYTVTSLEIAMEMYSLEPYNIKNRKKPTDIPAKIAKDTWEEPNPGNPPVAIEMEDNLYSQKTASRGIPITAGQYSNTGEFYTSEFIEVAPGDNIFFAPCSPYEDLDIAGYDKNKKKVTENIDLMNLDAVGFFTTGRLELKYTVPEGVSYVRVTFPQTVSPVITKNRQFTVEEYNSWLSAALQGAPITEPLTEPETEPATDPVTEPVTDPGDTSPAGTDTPAASSGGCGSSALCLFPLPILCGAVLFRKKKKE